MERIYSDHSRLDERSIAMHRFVAEKVRANPALLDKARENVRRWQEIDGSPMLALAEWEQILGGPANEVTRFLGSDPNAPPACVSPARSRAF